MCSYLRNIPADVSDLLAQAPHSVGVGYTPLMLVPLSYFVTISVISHLMDIDVNVLAVVVVLIAAVGISCVWLGFVSNGFKSKKTRVSYITIANLFNIALALILNVNVLQHAPENVTQLV